MSWASVSTNSTNAGAEVTTEQFQSPNQKIRPLLASTPKETNEEHVKKIFQHYLDMSTEDVQNLLAQRDGLQKVHEIWKTKAETLRYVH